MKNIIVIYHKDCTDGFSGAWAAWKKLGNKADYIGVRPGELPKEELKDKEIYFIDTLPRETDMVAVVSKNKKVVAIDHHQSGAQSAKLASDSLYKMENSGAVLAWQYFHPQKPTPQFLKHVEDFDLWKFKLPKSKEVFIYSQLFEFTFKNWDKLAKQMENSDSRKEVIKSGSLLLAYENQLVGNLVKKNAELVEFEGIKTLAVNAPEFQSQIANLLYKKLPPISIVWCEKEGKIKVSLRSDGTIDVAKIAGKYGGGGHKASSGFSFPADQPKPWKRI